MSLTVQAKVTSTSVARPMTGLRPRLLREGGAGREDADAYRAAGGYGQIGDPEALLLEVERSGLRGRGGAAFPTHVKIRSVRAGTGVPVVVANGEEGEPASVKDRWLLRHRPHLVLDGLRLAALLTGADRTYVYVSDEQAESSVRAALGEADCAGWPFSVDVVRVAPGYVAGEETAAVQAINGGPALPTDKPPRPFEEGVDGRPTLVSNVETLANLPAIVALGADGYRAVGTEMSPGTFLLTLTGCDGVGLYEVAFGTTLRELLTWIGQDPTAVAGVLMGGYFAGVLGAHVLDVPLDYAGIAGLGSGLGCGAIALIRHEDCPVDVSASVMAFFARENAGQCGSCFNGTAAMSAVLAALCRGDATAEDLDRLQAWSTNLRGRGACGTLDGATNVARTVLTEFPDAVEAHLLGAECAVCRGDARAGDRPYALVFDRPTQP